MLLEKSKKGIFLTIVDVSILVASFLIALGIRHEFLLRDLFNIPLQFRVYLLGSILIWIFLSHKFNLYNTERLTGLYKECLIIIKTAIISIVIATLPAFYFREDPLSRLFLAYHFVSFNFLLILFRYFLRETLKYIRLKGYDEKNIIIVGRNKRTQKILNLIENSPELGINVIGLVDTNDDKYIYPDNYGYKYLGGIDKLADIFRNEIIDDVIVTLPMKSFYSEINQVINICEQIGVEVKLSINLFSQRVSKVNIFNFNELKFLNFYTSPVIKSQLFIKRVVDLGLSLLAIILLGPLFLIISAAIKFRSKGPVFFIQKRIGYNGRIFSLFKFRTMVENAESLQERMVHLNEQDGPVFKMNNDPRVTDIGRFLRKTSLDELPQLINVIKGDMSLVGPRPPVPDEVSNYELSHRRRLSIRPGITCTWQVNGRNQISFEKWMELDREYIDNWSIWLDFKIMLKTIPAVLKGTGI